MVELHVHLDGCVRLETAYELLRKKQLPLPGDGTFEEFKAAVKLEEFIDLQTFLTKFAIFIPGIIDDFDAIERIAYEFCQDKSSQGVVYVEARYSPQLLLSEARWYDQSDLDRVVEAVNRGFARGSNDFNINAKSILSCIRGKKGWSTEVLRLARKYKAEGVVAIDIAGTADTCSSLTADELKLFDEDVAVFETAKREGIHRTVHAGECGGAQEVQKALEELHAERIGHGYHCIDDPNVYQHCLQNQVHLECCPWSSLMTGSIKLEGSTHPIVRFAKDGMNFSINTDDPTVTWTTLQDEYKLVKSWGLTDEDIRKANINAATNCFADEKEKIELIEILKKAYCDK